MPFTSVTPMSSSSSRRSPISYETHRSVEFVLGVMIGGLPVALTVGQQLTPPPAVLLIAGILGGLLTIQGVAETRRGEAVNAAIHAALDRVLAVITVIAGASFCVTGETLIGIVCCVGGALLAVLSALTRYVVAPEDIPEGPG